MPTVPGNSFVYIPSLKAVVTGDIVFDQVYFGVPRDAARENWMKTVSQIAALNPAIVIPGHEGPAATHDMRAIEWMKKYIADWDANVAKSKTPAEMRANVLQPVSAARNGVHAERPDRDLFPRAGGARRRAQVSHHVRVLIRATAPCVRSLASSGELIRDQPA